MFQIKQSDESALRTVAKLILAMIILAALSEFALPYTFWYVHPEGYYQVQWYWSYYFSYFAEFFSEGAFNLASLNYFFHLVTRMVPIVFLTLGLIFPFTSSKKDNPLEILSSRRVITPIYLSFLFFLINFLTIISSYIYYMMRFITYISMFQVEDYVMFSLMILFGQDEILTFAISLYAVIFVGRTCRFRS